VKTALTTILALSVAAVASAAAPQAVVQTPRDIPIAQQVDVLVVGGSTGAVAAATAAAQQGAKVFLVTPRNYLGDDMTATLRLWLEKGETPQAPLAKALFNDAWRDGPRADPDRLPLSYQADKPSSKAHADTNPPSRLTDGLWGRPESESVQYDGDVTITADLQKPQPIRGVRVVYYYRESSSGSGAFQVDVVTATVSDDGKQWRPLAEMRHSDGEKRNDYFLGNCFALTAKVDTQARYVRLAIKKPAEAGRILLGEIEILGPTKVRPATGDVPPVRPLHVKKTLDDALLKAGVGYLYGCYATDVLHDLYGQPCGIVMANRAGRQAIVAKTIIDATDRALVARLAGAKFRPYPAGAHTFRRVVIGGQPRSAENLTVRRIEPAFRGLPAKQGNTSGEFPIYEYTLQLPMADASMAAWAKADQQARTLTYDPQQQFTSDALFEVPPDAVYGRRTVSDPTMALRDISLEPFRPSGLERIWIVGGCADLDRAQAAALLRPLNLIDVGTRIGQAAAAEAKALPATKEAQLVAAKPASGAAPAAAGEIRETLSGVRPTEKYPTLPAAVQNVPVIGRYQVVVIGGGTGGAPAGIAAARQGARTLVVEYLHGLGGVGTIGAISSYYSGNRVGFTATVQGSPKATPWIVEEKAEWWRHALLEAGGDLWYGSIGCGVLVENGQVRGALVATPHGRGVVLADVVIDATGNADVAAAAGVPCIYTDASEFGMQGTGLPPRQLGTSYTNTDFTFTDETDIVDVWQMLVHAKNKYPNAFDQGTLIDTRERRCIVGDFTISFLDEILERTYPDTICQAKGGPFDTHGYTVDPLLTIGHPTHTNKLIVNIPFRAMLPKGLEGLLVVGLGTSARRDAIPLIRMQADIQNGGYAAGVAAATAAKAGTLLRHIDIRALQQHLVEIGNLTPDVIGAHDSFPLPPARVAEAVKEAPERFADLATVFLQPADARAALHEAYAAATGEAKQKYALILCTLGDRTGADALLQQVAAVREWDKGWNYRGMGQFGNAMSPLDGQLVALGRARQRQAVPVIAGLLAQLKEEDAFSHFRAAALALELIGDPAAAPALAQALQQPGIAGRVHRTIDEAIAQEMPGGTNAEQTRRNSLRELILARALYRCGDQNGLGEKTLRQYTQDLRGHLARHAKAILEAGNKP